MVAGESVVVTMGLFELASPSNPYTEWFSMANFDLPSPIAFGSEVPGDIFDPVATVPEAETWAMMLAGLGLLGLVSRLRKPQHA